MRLRIVVALLAGLAWLSTPWASAQEAAGGAEGAAFFEREVWPVLEKSCAGCHNQKVRTSGFSMASREDVLAGGNKGPVFDAANPPESTLVAAIEHSGKLKMPPTGKLPEAEVAVLKRWVEMGLPWSGAPARVEPRPTHWSFQPIRKAEPPAVRNQQWARNPIDRFVLARLEKEGLAPSPEAPRQTLIRRLSLDLTGLLPTPAEVREFVEDTSDGAYERLVERLLASPHYGERWGRHWLDVARYADSNGYNIDDARQIWMYRDWVIQALNRDLPFDQFTIEQIAGDMLPGATREQIVATGFHRNTLLNLEGGIDFEQYRVEAVVDRVDNTGAAFLGLTLGCARCHDHKFDPVSQREFYRLYAFFNNIDELSGEHDDSKRPTAHEPVLEFGSPEELARRDTLRAQIKLLEEEMAAYEKELLAKQPEWEKALTPEAREKLDPSVASILDLPAEKRNDIQREALERAYKATDLSWVERRKGISAIRKLEPEVPSTMVMKELEKPRQAYIQIGGDFLRKGDPVEAGVPAILPSLEASGRATRLDLARWLVSRNNPLTPRVTVNRVWQRYFGRGIVDTENDFGTQGSRPSHPELLDWLAAEFMDRDWSQKELHRLIVTSATYRQASEWREELAKADPDNRLLGRQNRLRLEAEIVRDAALSASGKLTAKIGGPSVHPPQPAGAGRVTQIDRKWVADTGPDRYRRGMYTFFWRSAPHPGLMVFDAPDSTTSCTRRNRSNTPLQALTLLNDEAYVEFAQALAGRVLEREGSNASRIEHAFELCLSRQPKPDERQRLEQLLATRLDDFATHPEAAREAAGPEGSDREAPRRAAWTAVSRVLLNLDEFITRE